MQFLRTFGIIGYDCGSSSANITTLSLLNIEECDIPQKQVNSSSIYVQLLQINDFQSTRVIQCKVEIDRLIRKCGMFSHTMDVHNGKYSYIEPITRQTCRRMHDYGSYQLGNTYITGLKSNTTTARPVTLAGTVDNDGKCSGGSYSDPYGTWSDVLVIGSVKITLHDYTADMRIIKLILDTIVHGYALHTVYGWSLYLLGAIWDSLTHLLLHLRTRAPSQKRTPTAPTSESQPSRTSETARSENCTTPLHVYPSLSPKENTSYSLEIKESKF